MRRCLGRAGAVLAVIAAAGPAGMAGQDPTASISSGRDLASRVASAPDGWVRFTYAAREGVCGNGRSISTNRESSRRGDRGWFCEEGPVRIELRVRDGILREIETEVGGTWDQRSGAVTDLGGVHPTTAAGFLLSVAETEPEAVAEDAIFPATLARGVETWPRLLHIARSDTYTAVREKAVFWLGQAASERATEGLTSIIDDEGELEVREHAIFALSQREEPAAFDALIRVARSSPEPALKRRAIFWLGQRGDDPRVLELLEEILTDGR